MNTRQIIDMQERIGAEPDGFWGPKSIAAVQRHLRKLMPKPNPWPKTDQSSLTAAFGTPGDESRHSRINVDGLGVEYAGRKVKEILCNAAVAESLYRVIWNLSTTPVGRDVLALYDGCYNNRPMRGGTTPSLHARAAAIDFNADENGNRVSWPARATMPLSVMEEFAKEGWIAAGAFWGRDAMHFQATQ